MKVQDLIANAPASREEDRFVEVRVRLFTYGNEAAVWKTVRSFMRNSTLHAGSKIEFFVGGNSLEDEDDHAILEQVEQELPPQPAPTGRPSHLTPSPGLTHRPQGPPFDPTWDSDTHAGHAPWCAVRVKNACSCGYEQWKLEQDLPKHEPTKRDYSKDPWMGSGLEIQY